MNAALAPAAARSRPHPLQAALQAACAGSSPGAAWALSTPPLRRLAELQEALQPPAGQWPSAAARALQARRLQPQGPAFVQALAQLGPVATVTRHAACVLQTEGAAGTTLPDAAGRVQVYAVEEMAALGPQHSLHFFDAWGRAVHQILAGPDTPAEAWAALVQAFEAPAAPPAAALPSFVLPAVERADARIDVAAFRRAWAGLRSTADHLTLLQAHGVSRTQALRLAETRFAQPVDAGCARELLCAAAGSGLPVTLYAGDASGQSSPCAHQSAPARLRRVEPVGPWLQVHGEQLRLQLREDLIVQRWVVRRPTCDGLVTSLELFDAQGRAVLSIGGAPGPGRPEPCGWRVIVERLVNDPHWKPEGQACAPC